MRWLLAALLLLPSLAYAVAPELCGSGIDEPAATGGTANGTAGSCPVGFADSVTGVGCDRLCPGNDKDNDGYTANGVAGTSGSTAIDCDDTNKWAIPGQYTPSGCSGGQVRLCNASNGSFGSCVAPSTVCEATGSGVCYWIDLVNGNDANSGTFASPFKTFGKISGGSGASGLPASPVTLTAGSVVYVTGLNVAQATITSSASSLINSQPVLGEFASNGTASDRIVIKSFTPAMVFAYNTTGTGLIVRGNYYRIELGFYTGRGASTNGTGLFAPGNNITTDRSYFAGMLGHGDNNDACVYCSHTNNCKIYRSVFLGCSRQIGNVDNINAIKWLDTNGNASECFGHEANWNTIIQASQDAVNGGGAFHHKSGCNSSDVGAGKWPIKYNRIANVRYALRWNGSSLRFAGNIVDDATELGRIFNDGGSALHDDNEITDNAFKSVSQLGWNDPTYGGTHKLRFLRNVLTDYRTGYVGGNNDGVISIDGYGSAGNRTTFETPPYYLEANNNCYYNPNTALTFSYYNQGDTSGQFTFAQWQARAVPYDANSFVENPNFNAFYQAQSANCLNKGVQFNFASPPSTGGTQKSHVFSIIKRRKR